MTEKQLMKMYPSMEKAALKLRAINNKFRRQLINLIQTNQGQLTVTQIYCKLRWEQSVASQHLAILRRAGIITGEKRGKEVYYSVNTNALLRLEGYCSDILNLN